MDFDVENGRRFRKLWYIEQKIWFINNYYDAYARLSFLYKKKVYKHYFLL